MQKYYLPINKVVWNGQYILVLQKNDQLTIMRAPTEEVKQDENDITVYNDLYNNENTVVRNKLNDFDWMRDTIILCTNNGGVLMARDWFSSVCATFTFYPLSCMGSNFVSQVSCGDYHWLLLTSSGFLYSFGKGEYGWLGLGDQEDREEPSMIYCLLDFTVEKIHTTKYTSIACCKVRNGIPVALTHTHSSNEKVTTLVEADQNIVYTWGKGEGGCLGQGSEEDISTPTPLSLSIEESISKIAAGNSHTFALDNKNNCIYAWGLNDYGQLSFPPTVRMLKTPEKVTSIDKKVIDIFCSEDSSSCITEKELTAGVKFEEIYSWGSLNEDKHAPKRFFKMDSVINIAFSK